MLAAWKDSPGSVGFSVAIGHDGVLGVTIAEGGKTHLKLFGRFCQDLLHSIRIFTHLNIISSPPRKSMPNCTMSPSLMGNSFDSIFGWLSLIWFKKVPDELQTSLTCHWPSLKLNSQCFRLTTLDLKPTGASDGTVGFVVGIPSRSEYRPTRITESSLGNVRVMGVKGKDCRPLRNSWWGKRRIVGSGAFVSFSSAFSLVAA